MISSEDVSPAINFAGQTADEHTIEPGVFSGAARGQIQIPSIDSLFDPWGPEARGLRFTFDGFEAAHFELTTRR